MRPGIVATKVREVRAILAAVASKRQAAVCSSIKVGELWPGGTWPLFGNIFGKCRNGKEMEKMIRTVARAGLIFFTACGAFGQTAPTPSFEVASIKPAPPPTEGRLMIMMSGGPDDRSDPSRVELGEREPAGYAQGSVRSEGLPDRGTGLDEFDALQCCGEDPTRYRP